MSPLDINSQKMLKGCGVNCTQTSVAAMFVVRLGMKEETIYRTIPTPFMSSKIPLGLMLFQRLIHKCCSLWRTEGELITVRLRSGELKRCKTGLIKTIQR